MIEVMWLQLSSNRNSISKIIGAVHFYKILQFSKLYVRLYVNARPTYIKLSNILCIFVSSSKINIYKFLKAIWTKQPSIRHGLFNKTLVSAVLCATLDFYPVTFANTAHTGTHLKVCILPNKLSKFVLHNKYCLKS